MTLSTPFFFLLSLFVFAHSAGNFTYPTTEYHDQQQLYDFLKNVSLECPFAETFSVGKSVQGQTIWGISFKKGVNINTRRPRVGYIANIHGNEVVGREMALYFAGLLCDTWQTDPAIENLLNLTDIYIIPSLNPDGYALGIRRNLNGKDLNRDFPDHFRGDPDSTDGRQPETIAFMNWYHNIGGLHLSANLHGGNLVANYPWDGLPNLASSKHIASICPDNEIYINISKAYSYAHTTMHLSVDFPDGITNGADWYTLYGGLQDWVYSYNHAYHLTLELSKVPIPVPSLLPSYWDQNKIAMSVYASNVHQGVHGHITNSFGDPVPGVLVTLIQYPSKKTYGLGVYSDSKGYYNHLALPGTYLVGFQRGDSWSGPNEFITINPLDFQPYPAMTNVSYHLDALLTFKGHQNHKQSDLSTEQVQAQLDVALTFSLLFFFSGMIALIYMRHFQKRKSFP